MFLHIVRHGKTNQNSPTGRDFDRELLPKGVGQSEDLGNYIKLSSNCHVLCSSAKRTVQTFEIMNRSLLASHVNYSEDLYLTSRSNLIHFLSELKHTDDVLIVGHNYGISDLVSYLTEHDIELRTGEYIELELEVSNWNELSQGTAIIRDRYRPHVDL